MHWAALASRPGMKPSRVGPGLPRLQSPGWSPRVPPAPRSVPSLAYQRALASRPEIKAPRGGSGLPRCRSAFLAPSPRLQAPVGQPPAPLALPTLPSPESRGAAPLLLACRSALGGARPQLRLPSLRATMLRSSRPPRRGPGKAPTTLPQTTTQQPEVARRGRAETRASAKPDQPGAAMPTAGSGPRPAAAQRVRVDQLEGASEGAWSAVVVLQRDAGRRGGALPATETCSNEDGPRRPEAWRLQAAPVPRCPRGPLRLGSRLQRRPLRMAGKVAPPGAAPQAPVVAANEDEGPTAAAPPAPEQTKLVQRKSASTRCPDRGPPPQRPCVPWSILGAACASFPGANSTPWPAPTACGFRRTLASCTCAR